MKNNYERFISLNKDDKRKVHIKACKFSLAVWNKYCEKKKKIKYRDSNCFIKHEVDQQLLEKALKAVIDNSPDKYIEDSFLEPIISMQDLDLEFPKNIEFAYYSIYNLYRKYCTNTIIDDWLIVNQALASEKDESRWETLFEEIMSKI